MKNSIVIRSHINSWQSPFVIYWFKKLTSFETTYTFQYLSKSLHPQYNMDQFSWLKANSFSIKLR